MNLFPFGPYPSASSLSLGISPCSNPRNRGKGHRPASGTPGPWNFSPRSCVAVLRLEDAEELGLQIAALITRGTNTGQHENSVDVSWNAFSNDASVRRIIVGSWMRIQRLGSDTDDDDNDARVRCSRSERVSTAFDPQFVERSSIRMLSVLDVLSEGKKCCWTSSAMRDSARSGVIFGTREDHFGCEVIAAAIAGVEWPLPPTRIRVWALLGVRER